MEARREQLSCPTCGEGVLVNVAYEDRFLGREHLPQDPSATEIRRYSCGHEWAGASLASADPDGLTTETRTSDETVEPTGVRNDRS